MPRKPLYYDSDNGKKEVLGTNGSFQEVPDAPTTALPTEYPATYAAMQTSITSDPTTKRDFFVTADETNGGVYTEYYYNGTTLIKKNSNQYETVYVETYGSDTNGKLGDKSNPFQTIQAAITALPSTGGIVKIGRGDFTSPTTLKANLILMGSGKPVPNWTLAHNSNSTTVQTTYTSPTKLQNGTVLKGSLGNKLYPNVVLQDLGVDTGSDWCTASNGGNAANAIYFEGVTAANTGQASEPQLTGIAAINVSALCKASSSSVHAMLFQNVYNFHGQNLSTYFGQHGFALKGIGGEVKGIDAHGHQSNGVILKGDDYAYGTGPIASNIYITSIGSFDGGGLRLVGLNSTLRSPKITNFFIENTTMGIVAEGAIEGMMLSNGTIYNVSGNGINIPNTCTKSIFHNIHQKTGVTGWIISLAAGDVVSMSNLIAESNSGQGFSLTAGTGTIITNNLSAINNTGAGFSLGGSVYGFNNQNIGSGATVGSFVSDSLIPSGSTGTKTLGSSSVYYGTVYSANFYSPTHAFYGTTNSAREINIVQASNFLAKWFTSGNAVFEKTTSPTEIASAMVAFNATTKGVCLPRMTTAQKNAISSPAQGLEVFDTDLKKKCVYSGTAWETITSA